LRFSSAKSCVDVVRSVSSEPESQPKKRISSTATHFEDVVARKGLRDEVTLAQG
jgi:hypothetical protein